MQGLMAIYRKEMTDHFSSYRFVILFGLIAMVSFIASYMAGINLRENLEGVARPKFVFLMLFNTTGALFSMVQFVAFFGPLLGLVLGFDTINRERAHGTLIKLLSQPSNTWVELDDNQSSPGGSRGSSGILPYLSVTILLLIRQSVSDKTPSSQYIPPPNASSPSTELATSLSMTLQFLNSINEFLQNTPPPLFRFSASKPFA